MNCLCDCSFPITVKTSAVTLTGGSLYLTLPGVNIATLSNLQKLNVIICQSIPSNAGTAQVFLSDGTTNLPINVVTGNYLRADQIKCRRVYKMIYGNDPVHASLLCPVYPTSYVPTTAAAASATEVSAQVASVSVNKKA